MFKPGKALERTPPPKVTMETLRKSPLQPEIKAAQPEVKISASGTKGKKNKKRKNKISKSTGVGSKKLDSIQKDVDERQASEERLISLSSSSSEQQSSSESENDERIIAKVKENVLKRAISESDKDDENNIKKAKNENLTTQSESGDDIEMDAQAEDHSAHGDEPEAEPEPEGEQNGNEEIANEVSKKISDERRKQEEQEKQEKERAENETRKKQEAEARERADREEFKKKMAEHEESKTVFIKGRNTDITKVNPRKARKEICDVIGGGFSITQSRDSLRLICSRMEQKENVMRIKTILDHDVIITEPYNLTRAKTRNNVNRGIIFGVQDDITDEEMTEELGLKAEMIIKKIAGRQIRTAQMILHFDGDLPPYVRFEWKRYRVSQYIPEPVRCYKCQKFGHKAPSCHAKKAKCTICSGPHEVLQCPIKMTHREEQTAKCPNCKGSHPASYHGCPEFKIAKQAQKKHVLQKISYADAVRRCREEREEKMNAPKEKQAANVPPSAETTSRPSGETTKNIHKPSEK